MTAIVRRTSPVDTKGILAVHRLAFPTDAEMRLVELLMQHGKATVSLAAIVGEQIVGHILFSPVTSDLPGAPAGLGLAPLAVVPQYQGQGIGSALARAGLDHCRQLQAPYVVVLGSPAYYSRFGFQPASRWNLTCEFGGGEAFQFLSLGDPPIPPPSNSGQVRYASEFTEIFDSPK